METAYQLGHLPWSHAEEEIAARATRPCLRDENVALTYDDFDRRVRAAAEQFAELGLQIDIVEDHHRRLAAQLQVRALEGLGGGLEDFLPGDDVAGQRHHAHLGVADQVAADAFAAATENVDHAAPVAIGAQEIGNIERRLAEEFIPALVLQHQELALDRADGLLRHVAVVDR